MKNINASIRDQLLDATDNWQDKLEQILSGIHYQDYPVPDISCRELRDLNKLSHMIIDGEYKKALNFMQSLDTITREDSVPRKIWDLLHKINGAEY